MEDSTLIYNIVIVGLFHVFTLYIVGKRIKQYLTTKAQHDKLKEKERVVNNEKVFLEMSRQKLKLSIDEIEEMQERIKKQEQMLALQKLEYDLTNFHSLNALLSGLFYDRENDTIVLMENLLRIGEK